MRLLKFNLYQGGNVGFFNNLMSLELGVGLSVLSNRFLLLSQPKHPVFNSDKGLNLFDFVDLFYPHGVGNFDDVQGELLPDLHSSRLVSANLLEFEEAPVLATCNDSTLGYYSYTLCYDPRVVYACNRLIAIKAPYRLLANSIVREIRKQHGPFASIHIRRADFLQDHEKANAVTVEEICHNIACHVPSRWLLLIHSDEREEQYFEPIIERWPRHLMIDAALFRGFFPDRMDAAEIGIISALIASESDVFLGTMCSTFTGHIQRWRLLNGKDGGFLYLYNQRPECLAFQDGRILESGTTGPTWERIEMPDDLKSICFWWREWPESVAPREDCC